MTWFKRRRTEFHPSPIVVKDPQAFAQIMTKLTQEDDAMTDIHEERHFPGYTRQGGQEHRRRVKFLEKLPLGSRIEDGDHDTFAKLAIPTFPGSTATRITWVLMDDDGNETNYHDGLYPLAESGFTVLEIPRGDDTPSDSAAQEEQEDDAELPVGA